ncbi:inositol-trisphosphate 3-kinase A [Eucyclogobius newberryi]|uniref:inositol-trisphosphate 3-kinase A n=1 Tax=Eucyclogobius newberryi TaxID=166745 RepID=UPI003B5C46BD
MMETDTTNNQTAGNDLMDALSDEMKNHLLVSKRSSSVKTFSRPILQATKSFPPYSQCIGGLGQDTEMDPDSNFEQSNRQNNADAAVKMDKTKDNTVELTDRCMNSVMKGTRRLKRKDRLEGRCEMCPEEWECIKCLRSRRAEKHGIIHEATASIGEMEKYQDDKMMDQKGQEMSSRNEDIGRSSPHPILSKLLHSSTSSSCSSVCASSGESDEVFSEGEGAVSKRKKLKKCRSWKTFFTMMHWSLKRQSSWVQLAGHQGNFQLSDGGEVLKLYSEVEATCLDILMKDPLRPFVPQYYGLVTRGEHCYIRLEDLLSGLRSPVIMDCKMGVRTYQEEEVMKAQTRPQLRNDMYQRMVKVDPSALSTEEHAQMGVTKWRYLHWRDAFSSTSTLGFRIEGIMTKDGHIRRDFKNILTLAQVTETLLFFTRNQLNVLKAYHSRLLALEESLKCSPFFRNHEIIGSSLLFVHDHSNKACVWMIDFGKTTPVPEISELKHNVPWTEGSREDGYLLGLTSLITSLSQAISKASWQQKEDD